MASTRLTNEMRDSFIRRVMADVPTVDYDQKIRDAVNKAVQAALPKEVKKLLADEQTRGFVNTNGAHVEAPEYVFFSDIPSCGRDWLQKIADAAAEPFLKPWEDQKKRDDELSTRLRSIAYHCNTVKKLADALPEFAAYMPKDESDAIKTLPAIANVVADFVKAGWPKGKKAPA